MFQILQHVIHFQAIDLRQNQLLEPSDRDQRGKRLGGKIPLQIVAAEDVPNLVDDSSSGLVWLPCAVSSIVDSPDRECLRHRLVATRARVYLPEADHD